MQPLLEVLLRRRVGFFRCARPRLDKWPVVQLVEDDAFLADVRDEVLLLADGLVHLSPDVYDEADRRLNFPLMPDALHRLVPVGLVPAELPAVPDDQQVEVCEVTFSGMRLVYTGAPGIDP